MSLARDISRGAFLNARFGVNGTQHDSRSFGTDETGRVARDIAFLWKARPTELQPIPARSPSRNAAVPQPGRAFAASRPSRCTDQMPQPRKSQRAGNARCCNDMEASFRFKTV